MVQIIQKQVSNCTMTNLIKKLVADEISDEIKKKTNSIHPLKCVYIKKVKVLKKPKMDGNSFINPTYPPSH